MCQADEVDPNIIRAQTLNTLDELVTEFLNMGPNGEALDAINESCNKIIEGCQKSFRRTDNLTYLGMAFVISIGVNSAILAWLDREELNDD